MVLLLGKLVSDTRFLVKGNIKALTVRDILLTTIAGLTGGLDSLFIKEILGADAVVLGLLASIWSGVFLVFILIGGWISDHYDRKKMLIAGMALTIPNPIIFALALDWRVTVLAHLLGAIGSALVAPAYVALLYSSSEQQTRSRAIALMNTLTSMANVVVPPLGALLVLRLGGLNEIRRIFLAQFLLSFGALAYTYRRLENRSLPSKSQPKGLTESVNDIFGQMSMIYTLSKERKATSWLLIALTGPWAWEVAAPFWIIYAAETCGAPILVLGLLPAAHSLIAALLLFPLAEISDRKGRKRIILLTRPFLYLCVASLIVGGTFRGLTWVPFVPLLAWIMRAIGESSSPSWTAASTEVIPEELQSEWEATRDFLWRVMAIPASVLGGFLWNMDTRLPFAVAILVDGLIRFPLLIFLVPETLVVHRPPQPLGPHIILYGLPATGKSSIARLIKRELSVDVVDEAAITRGSPKALTLFRFKFIGSMKERLMAKKVNELLSQAEGASVIEGEAAFFAAKEGDKGMVVLLVASKDERVRRESMKSHAPEFVALKELEDEDRKVSRLTKRLYGVDISKLPPFDVAINTERIRPEKIVRIISLLRGREELAQGVPSETRQQPPSQSR